MYVYIIKSESSFWISKFGTFSIRKTILLEQKESSCGHSQPQGKYNTACANFAHSYVQLDSPCTQQLAWLLEILPLRSPGFQRFSACWPLEWTMPCHLSSSRRFCSWRGLCNCLENMGSSDLLASPEWKVSPRMNQNLQVRVSRSFSSFKSVDRCECEHACVLLTYPQVFRDVLHRPGKFGS